MKLLGHGAESSSPHAPEDGGIRGAVQHRSRVQKDRLPRSPWAIAGLLALLIALTWLLTSDAGRIILKAAKEWNNTTIVTASSIGLTPAPGQQQRHQEPVIVHQLKQHKQQAGALKGAWDEPCAALQGEVYLPFNDSRLVAAVVVVGHNRPDYLTRTIGSLIGVWRQDPANAARFPLYISIDGADNKTLRRAAELCSDHGHQLQLLNHKHKPYVNSLGGYNRLADHYKWLLRIFFECYQSPRLIFLEDDMLVAPDFFSYFNALAPMMAADSTLWCISCWNDNGQPELIENNTRLYRTDYFPGLGWMTTREKGLLMSAMWPRVHWDGFLRRKHGKHQCIYPEVSRTHTFGAEGTSGGQFYDGILSTLQLNSMAVRWEEQDFSYLQPQVYAAQINQWVADAQSLTVAGLMEVLKSNDTSTRLPSVHFKVSYTAGSRSSFQGVAKQIDKRIMTDESGTWPRTGFQGIVVLHVKGHRVLLVPSTPLNASKHVA